jgi:hypothetical protein
VGDKSISEAQDLTLVLGKFILTEIQSFQKLSIKRPGVRSHRAHCMLAFPVGKQLASIQERRVQKRAMCRDPKGMPDPRAAFVVFPAGSIEGDIS